jgi:hypothetical protein
MSTEISNLVWKYSKQKGSRLLLLAALADYANAEAWCWPSIKSLCQRTRMGERYVQQMIRDICQDGELEVREKEGSSNSYRITIGVNPSAPLSPGSPGGEAGCAGGVRRGAPRTVKGTVKEPSSTVGIEIPVLLNTPEFQKAWADWMGYLKDRRMKPTQRTIDGHIKACEEYGSDLAVRAINYSIESQYRKPFPPPAAARGTKPPKPAADYTNGAGFGETRHLRFD